MVIQPLLEAPNASLMLSCITFASLTAVALQPLEEALADYRLNSAHDYPREAATTRLVERGYSVGVGFLLGVCM